jgi:hypothetical protein
MNRLSQINNQFTQNPGKGIVSKENISVDGKSYTEIIDHHPDREIKINFFKL